MKKIQLENQNNNLSTDLKIINSTIKILSYHLRTLPYQNARIASIDYDWHEILGNPNLSLQKVLIRNGDYSEFMSDVNKYLTSAQKYAANQNQKEMIKFYIKHFQKGDIFDHKMAQISWVKDLNPMVEVYLGGGQNFREQEKISRFNFESFVALKNKNREKYFESITSQAQNLIKHLPWSDDFNEKIFVKPEFISLDIMAQCSSQMIGGVNLPFYRDIRWKNGFKNLHFYNMEFQPNFNNKNSFINQKNQDLISKNFTEISLVKLTLNQLIGHGSGKLFVKTGESTFNFDHGKVINPLTKKPVKMFYQKNETFLQKFKFLAYPLEELRADLVSMYLCTFDEILEILLPGKNQIFEQVRNGIWLSMVYSAVQGLFWYAQNQKWVNPNFQSRWVIFKVLMETKQVIKINWLSEEDFEISIDYSKIKTVGQKALGNILLKLQVFKSLGDVKSAQILIEKYSSLNTPLDQKLMKCVQQKIFQSRKQNSLQLEIFPELYLQEYDIFSENQNQVVYKKFDSSIEGAIQSCIEHFRFINLENFYKFWKNDTDQNIRF